MHDHATIDVWNYAELTSLNVAVELKYEFSWLNALKSYKLRSYVNEYSLNDVSYNVNNFS